MLATRLATGLTLVAVLLAVLILDERLAPWFPLWFVTVAGRDGASARWSWSGLLGATERPALGQHGLRRDGRPGAGQLGARTSSASSGIDPDPADPADVTTRSAPVDVMAWPLWTFVAVLMAAFLSQSLQFRRPGQTMATIAGTVLAVAYVGLLGSFIIQMRWFEGPYHGLIPLASLVATAKGSDIGAYTLGRIAGRHKLWPRLSPNKTVEGAVGGLVFGVAAVADRRGDRPATSCTPRASAGPRRSASAWSSPRRRSSAT